MTIDLLGDLTENDCNADRLLFEKGEVVKFVGIEPRVEEAKGHIFLRAKVLSGMHAGKEHTIMIAGGDHEVAKKRRAQFFFRSGFWTQAELAEKDPSGKPVFSLQKIVGREFQGKASKVTTKDGNSYQNIDDLKDLGPSQAGAAAPLASTY